MDQLIEHSHATESFKFALRTFLEGSDAEHIEILGYAPRVKVERVLTQLLNAESALPIERVQLVGRSGCSDFIGEMTVTAVDGATHRITFAWDCRWRAEQEGWTDCFGFPDQIRAAREFGWDCFHRWEKQPLFDEATTAFGHPVTA
jgi:hypothetical protein